MLHRAPLLSLGLLVLSMILFAGCKSPDCELNVTVKTWVDKNENGIWDDDESPLSDVESFVEGAYTIGVGKAVSDRNGAAHLSTMLAGCPQDAVFSVYVEAPSGYRLTTQERLPARRHNEGSFLFGFVPVNP